MLGNIASWAKNSLNCWYEKWIWLTMKMKLIIFWGKLTHTITIKWRILRSCNFCQAIWSLLAGTRWAIIRIPSRCWKSSATWVNRMRLNSISLMRLTRHLQPILLTDSHKTNRCRTKQLTWMATGLKIISTMIFDKRISSPSTISIKISNIKMALTWTWPSEIALKMLIVPKIDKNFKFNLI